MLGRPPEEPELPLLQSGGRDTFEMVPLGGQAVCEIPGVASLFKPIVDDSLRGGRAAVKADACLIEAGLVACDLSVEAGDLERHVGGAALLRLGLPLDPNRRLLAAGVPVPPAGAAVGGPLCISACSSGFGRSRAACPASVPAQMPLPLSRSARACRAA